MKFLKKILALLLIVSMVLSAVSCGGKGWHFVGDHKATIANLWKGLKKKGLV